MAKETRPYLTKAGWQVSKDGVNWEWTTAIYPSGERLFFRYIFTVHCAKGCDTPGPSYTYYSDSIEIKGGNHVKR